LLILINQQLGLGLYAQPRLNSFYFLKMNPSLYLNFPSVSLILKDFFSMRCLYAFILLSRKRLIKKTSLSQNFQFLIYQSYLQAF